MQFDFSLRAVKTKNKNLLFCIHLVMGIIIPTSPWNPQHPNNKSLSYCLTDGKCSWWRSLIFPRQKISASPASHSTSRLNTDIKHFHFPLLDPLSLLLVNNISRCRPVSCVYPEVKPFVAGGPRIVSSRADNRFRDHRGAPGADQGPHIHVGSTGWLLKI